MVMSFITHEVEEDDKDMLDQESNSFDLFTRRYVEYCQHAGL